MSFLFLASVIFPLYPVLVFALNDFVESKGIPYRYISGVDLHPKPSLT